MDYDAVAEGGRHKIQFTLRGENESNPSREIKFSGANGDSERKHLIFPVQLTTRRVGYHTR